jgi:hypothetical protein
MSGDSDGVNAGRPAGRCVAHSAAKTGKTLIPGQTGATRSAGALTTAPTARPADAPPYDYLLLMRFAVITLIGFMLAAFAHTG